MLSYNYNSVKRSRSSIFNGYSCLNDTDATGIYPKPKPNSDATTKLVNLQRPKTKNINKYPSGWEIEKGPDFVKFYPYGKSNESVFVGVFITKPLPEYVNEPEKLMQ